MLPGLTVICAALVVVALPIFLVGGLAVQIRSDLGFDEAALGAAVTIGFSVGALAAPLGGRLADRVGPRLAIYFGMAASSAAAAGIGLAADGWAAMVAFLSLAGLAVAVTDPGLAILVGRAIPHRRQGFAFGIKEASIPAATLAAGLAVPVLGLTVGWRWGFAIGIIPLVAVLVLLPRVVGASPPQVVVPRDQSPLPRQEGRRRSVVISGLGAALGTAAASGVGVFLTESAVAMGIDPGPAGLILALGSVAGIVARVAAGVAADRSGGPQFRLIAIMLTGGSVAMALGGSGSTWLLVVGAVGAFTGGWAWTGIYFLSLLRIDPDRPGAVAGVGSASLGVGNASGPILFGLVAQNASFETAWLLAGAAALAAAGLMALARLSLLR